ncbi:hypothetical protein ACFYYR_24540 [Streptomyces sp. NPDC001922]|uniref:hypothetical protein n=1 Tax=Streptomyces sp. NPDC001922 TaxID=3364624 RepID=UPI0036A22337
MSETTVMKEATPMRGTPVMKGTTGPAPTDGTPHRAAPGAAPDPAAERARTWLGLLSRQFPELLEELLPGRPGSRPSYDLAPADLLRQAQEARADRAAAVWNARHGITPLGGGAAPLRLHVSDALRDITDGVIELEEAVRDRLRLGRPRKADVPQRLARIAGLLDRIGDDRVLLEHVLTEARRMARRCGQALGEAEPLVRVRGRCPWCDSVSLRAFPVRRTVLCINPACRCADEECGCADSPAYRHTWPEDRWTELADASGTLPQDLLTAVTGDEA